MAKGELRVNTLYAGRRGGRFLALGGDGTNDIVSLSPEASSQKNGRFCRSAIVRPPPRSSTCPVGHALSDLTRFGGREGLISSLKKCCLQPRRPNPASASRSPYTTPPLSSRRSEEHTSELQSRQYLVCRLLL